MGVAATEDAFGLRSDIILQGVKIVDDVQFCNEAYLTHPRRINEVLLKCTSP